MRCWNYWRQNIETGEKARRYILLITFLLVQVGYFAAKHWNLDLRLGEIGPELLDVIEIVSIAASVFIALFWLPFVRHELQQKAQREQESEYHAEIESLEQRIKAITDKKQELFLEDFERSLTKQTLGECLLKLRDHLTHVRQLDYISSEVKEKEKAETAALLQGISDILDKRLGKDVGAIFLSPDIKPAPQPDARDIVTSEPH